MVGELKGNTSKEENELAAPAQRHRTCIECQEIKRRGRRKKEMAAHKANISERYKYEILLLTCNFPTVEKNDKNPIIGRGIVLDPTIVA